ncbi:hypothetical protein D3C72_2308900 [compost metagenome]
MVVAGLEQHIGQDRIGVAAFNHPMHMAQRLEQMIAFECDFHGALLPGHTRQQNPASAGVGTFTVS